jgi:hypothetical protein
MLIFAWESGGRIQVRQLIVSLNFWKRSKFKKEEIMSNVNTTHYWDFDNNSSVLKSLG